MTEEKGKPENGTHGNGFIAVMRSRSIWICVVAVLLAAAAIFWFFGFGLWTAVAFALLISCPVVVAWVLMIERQQNLAARKNR